MAEKKQYIPARVLWQSGGITTLIIGFFMLLIGALVYDANEKVQDNVNKFLKFKDAFYREVAYGSATQDQDIHVLASYARERREDLDKSAAHAKTLRDSLDKAQRMMVHIQSPDKVPQGLLLMTNSSNWQELWDNTQDRGVLKEILAGNIQPPEIKLLDSPKLSRTFIWLCVLILQLCAFVVYLFWWNEEYRKYRWYQLSWLGKIGFVLLMPGAGVLMIPMIIYACSEKLGSWLRQDNKKRHARREALKKGLSLDISLDAGKALLSKLQQSHRQ